jgi:hypothetical protein
MPSNSAPPSLFSSPYTGGRRRPSTFNIEPDADELYGCDWLELSDIECDDEALMDMGRPGRRKRAGGEQPQVDSEKSKEEEKIVAPKEEERNGKEDGKGKGKGTVKVKWEQKGTVAEYRNLQKGLAQRWF